MTFRYSSIQWASLLASLGLTFCIASVLLSWSSWQPSRSTLTAMQMVGGLLLLVSFLGRRKAAVQAGHVLPLRMEVFTFARPLIGRVTLVVSVLLAGAGMAGDAVSLTSLAFAALFFIVGIALIAFPRLYRL